MFPVNDDNFQEKTITKVNEENVGWSIAFDDGWSFFVRSSPIKPAIGMIARTYGKGIGFSIRGLFIDEVEVFYRTDEEEKKKREVDLYGADAADWLDRWDNDKGVWSIEMGGLGPGYEQAIQITVAEILRHLLEKKYDYSRWSEQEIWERAQKDISDASFKNETITTLGLSGAQYGAAVDLATKFYMGGPISVMTDEQVKNRKIQVNKSFP